MKSWRKSATLWFNSIIGVIPQLVSQLADIIPSIQPYVPNELYGKLFVVLIVGNCIIRVFRTKTALSFFPPLVK